MTPDGLACSFEKVFEAHGLRTSMERSIEVSHLTVYGRAVYLWKFMARC